MSTVGKVLTVLVILPALGWLFLASKVAEWNRSWGKQSEKLAKNIETTREQADQSEIRIAQLKREIDQLLRQKDDQVTGRRTLLSALLRSEGNLKETIDRYQLQQASMQTGVEASRRRLEVNNQELAETRKNVTDAQAELARLKEDNARTRSQLAELRRSFETTLAENRQLVERAQAAATASPASSSSSRDRRIAR